MDELYGEDDSKDKRSMNYLDQIIEQNIVCQKLLTSAVSFKDNDIFQLILSAVNELEDLLSIFLEDEEEYHKKINELDESLKKAKKTIDGVEKDQEGLPKATTPSAQIKWNIFSKDYGRKKRRLLLKYAKQHKCIKIE